MAAYVESKASFRHRCIEEGLTNGKADLLRDQSITTFNIVIYSICGQPGQIDHGRFRNMLDLTFTNAPLGLESMMRQLNYEAIKISVAATKQRIEPTVEGQTKKASS